MLCEHKGLQVQVQVSMGWWGGFWKRHPALTVRCAESTAHARVLASDSGVLNRYYIMLEATLKENGLLESPACIFNCDKTGMPLSPGPINENFYILFQYSLVIIMLISNTHQLTEQFQLPFLSLVSTCIHMLKMQKMLHIQYIVNRNCNHIQWKNKVYKPKLYTLYACPIYKL